MASIEVGAIIASIPALLGIWIIVSIPVYLAAKVVTSGRAKFTQAMGVTILGPLSYLAVVFVSPAILGAIFGALASILAVILALIVWLWVYKASFKTGWLAALGIAVLALIVFIAASFIIMLTLGMLMPDIRQPVLPTPLQQV